MNEMFVHKIALVASENHSKYAAVHRQTRITMRMKVRQKSKCHHQQPPCSHSSRKIVRGHMAQERIRRVVPLDKHRSILAPCPLHLAVPLSPRLRQLRRVVGVVAAVVRRNCMRVWAPLSHRDRHVLIRHSFSIFDLYMGRRIFIPLRSRVTSVI